MNDSFLHLSVLDIFFVFTAIVSLTLNVIQWRDRRAFAKPLGDNLIALFNDIKAKSTNANFVYGALFNRNNPHSDIETLKWEYGIFVQTVMVNYQGFQETVRGLLATVSPGDKDGSQVFRASDYGLTDEEKNLRRESARRLREQFEKPPSDAGANH